MERPLVSVIIPAYNAGSFLASSIQNVLRQYYFPKEIIIIDDGSSDNSEKIARSFKEVRYFYQENSGPAVARNLGIQMAKGNILAFNDADDLWSLDKLNVQYSEIEKDPSIEIVIGWIALFKGQDNKGNAIEILAPSQPIFAYSFGSSLIKKSAFEKVGLLDVDFIFGEDVDWFLRAREKKISIKMIEDVVLFYRKHQTNMTNNSSLKDLYLVRALKKSLNRRRKNDKAVFPLEDFIPKNKQNKSF